MATLLKGASVAARLTDTLAKRAAELKQRGVNPTLAILRIGDNPDDTAYEMSAAKRCDKAGIAVKRYALFADCARDDVLGAVREINADGSIHGCLVLRPLPDKAIENEVCALLSCEKDVDGMTPGSLAGVFTGSGKGFSPCTAEACVELLDYYGIELAGKRVTVVGRSLVVGRPLAMLLLMRNATVTMCHTGTSDLAAACRSSDILVAAAGRAGLIDARFVRPGQTVIDVGVNVRDDGSLCGDVDFSLVEPVAERLTPVPGGVGAVTAAVLAKHVIEAAERASSEAAL